ncbi:MAG: type II secretion system protein [Planctomycetaceae bacterium]
MRNHHSTSNTETTGKRPAFTLVEMLVSVTLVLLMMTLFASIFSMATDSVSRQKGISELDQGARILSNTIQADIAKRTFRYGMPFYPGEVADTSPTPFGQRSGYIYVSANDPDSGIDDILQFTVNSDLLFEEPDATPFFGSAALLYDQVAQVNGELRRAALRFNPNQPEADDSVLVPNGTAASPSAEISYFLRNGNLYRRVMLLRDPLDVVGGDTATDPRSLRLDHPYLLTETDRGVPDGGGMFWYVATPSAIDPFNRASFELSGSETSADRPTWNVTQSNDFWQEFDLSAQPIGTGGGGTNPSAGLTLIGTSALSNDTGNPFVLGNPAVRWGFDPYTAQSREHFDIAGSTFMGRFLSAETSDWRFNWPMSGCRNEPSATSFSGTLIGNGNPMDRLGTPLTFNNFGIADAFDGSLTGIGRGGSRKVEDLLLSNVHEFRVELWDERLGRYVTPGYGTAIGSNSELIGDFHIRRCLQADTAGGQFHHGPLAPYTPVPGSTRLQPHVFDTWNPDLATDPKFSFDGDPLVDQHFEISPPFIPYKLTPPLQPTGPTPTLIADPVNNEQVRIRAFTSSAVTDTLVTNRGYMRFSSAGSPVAYQLNDVVFVNWVDDPGALDGLFASDYSEMAEPKFQIAYRCVVAGDPGLVPTAPIAWPKTPGQRITFGGTQWEAIDNRQPLKSIRVKVRFQDPNTELLRQVTLTLPITVNE